MLVQKISILIFSLLLSLFNPDYTESNTSTISSISSDYNLNIDSLNAEVKRSGWNQKRLNSCYFTTINSYEDLNKEINKLPSGFEVSFLNAIHLKKEQKYEAMFDTLMKSFSDKVDFLTYHEELVFSASAVNKVNLIEEKISKEDFRFKEFLSGLISISKGENEKAVQFFVDALNKNSEGKNILYHLSYAYRNSGDYDNAAKVLKKAQELFPEDKWLMTKLLIAQGSLFILSGDYNSALISYEKGLQIALLNSDRQNEAKAYINIGIIEDISGNIEKAHNNFNRAINIASSIKDYENLAVAYSELGVSYTFTNEIIEAKNNYLKCLELFEKMNNQNRLSLLNNNIGKIYMNLFDYASALNYFKKGLKFSGDNKRSKALNLMGIADVYANLSNYTKAIQYYREAQKISSAIKEVSLNAEINSGIGSLNFNLDRFNNAIQYYSEAENFAEDSNNPYLLTDVTHKIAISYLELDSLDLSEKYFNKALQLSQTNSIPYYESLISLDLALLQMERKEYDQALKSIFSAEKKAEELSSDYLIARGKIIHGEIVKQAPQGENDFESLKKAEILFKEAGEISEKLKEYSLQIEANYLLAQLFAENNFTEAAESYYKSAVRLIEDVSNPLFKESEVQISYFSTQKDVYDSFARLYLNQKKFKEAFELIDKSRSRNTVQNLSNLKLQVLLDDKHKLEKIYEYEWIIHSGIDNDQYEKVKSEYSLFKEELISNNNQLEIYFNKGNHFTVKDIQQNLNGDEHFISFYLTEDKSFIFSITENGFNQFEINSGREEVLELKEKISPYFNNQNGSTFYNHDLFSFNANAAYEFYNVLLKKVFSKIPEGSKIIISPPGELVTLPFEFLVTSFEDKESAFSYQDKDYLIFHYNFSYTPSASVFVHQKKSDFKSSDKILVAGNPEINSTSNIFGERRGILEETGIPRNIALLPLKYSGEEIAQVSNLINADKVLTNNSATETGFKENAELAKIIHLSTHSFLFNKQPIIFFSNINDEENDGFLEAGEIVQMKLNSDLVVLSSCNSGLGNVDASEGIIGMTKAFFEAGAKSVVVSLWEVNDKYTSKFMALFYEKLSGGFDKDEAMRMAKIDFIKNYSPNPYFWSAFVLSGNTNKIELKSSTWFSVFIAGFSLIVLFVLIVFLRRRSK